MEGWTRRCPENLLKNNKEALYPALGFYSSLTNTRLKMCKVLNITADSVVETVTVWGDRKINRGHK